MLYYLVLCLMASVVATNANFSYNCMKCICEIEGCESQIGKCRMDKGSLSCGPYQIKRDYWIDCGQPGGDWQTCTKQMRCSETCVKRYMARYGSKCQTRTCPHLSRLHNGGPMGCEKSSTMDYYRDISRCCNRKGGC